MILGWNVERTAKLIVLWGDGLSAALIAQRLGRTTRNAVIGKINRLKLPRRKTSQSRPQKRSTRMTIPTPKPAVIFTTHADDLKIPLQQRLTFEQTRPGLCKFPVGAVHDPDFCFCGAACTGIYCDDHAERCYNRTSRR